MDILNFKIAISDDCSEINTAIIKHYWEIDENFEIVNSPNSVKKKFDVTQSKINSILKKYCRVSFYELCNNCNSYELRETTSHTNFNLSKNNGRYKNKICVYCQTSENQRRERIENKRIEEVYNRLNTAISHKVWKSLDAFHKELLNNCLNNSFSNLKSIYWEQLGQVNYPKLFRGLNRLAELDLLILSVSKWDNRIEKYQYLKKLKEEFIYTPIKKEAKPLSNDTFNTSNHLKFRLTNNHNRKSRDGPKYSGTVIFKERIIIEPNVEYSFAHWDRNNEDLYLSLIPTDDIYPLPVQERLSNLPKSLREGIQDFFNNIKPNY